MDDSKQTIKKMFLPKETFRVFEIGFELNKKS